MNNQELKQKAYEKSDQLDVEISELYNQVEDVEGQFEAAERELKAKKKIALQEIYSKIQLLKENQKKLENFINCESEEEIVKILNT